MVANNQLQHVGDRAAHHHLHPGPFEDGVVHHIGWAQERVDALGQHGLRAERGGRDHLQLALDAGLFAVTLADGHAHQHVADARVVLELHGFTFALGQDGRGKTCGASQNGDADDGLGIKLHCVSPVNDEKLAICCVAASGALSGDAYLQVTEPAHEA